MQAVDRALGFANERFNSAQVACCFLVAYLSGFGASVQFALEIVLS